MAGQHLLFEYGGAPVRILLDRPALLQIICPLIPERYKSDSGGGGMGRGGAGHPPQGAAGAAGGGAHHARMRLQCAGAADFNANRRLVPRDSWEGGIQLD